MYKQPSPPCIEFVSAVDGYDGVRISTQNADDRPDHHSTAFDGTLGYPGEGPPKRARNVRGADLVDQAPQGGRWVRVHGPGGFGPPGGNVIPDANERARAPVIQPDPDVQVVPPPPPLDPNAIKLVKNRALVVEAINAQARAFAVRDYNIQNKPITLWGFFCGTRGGRSDRMKRVTDISRAMSTIKLSYTGVFAEMNEPMVVTDADETVDEAMYNMFVMFYENHLRMLKGFVARCVDGDNELEELREVCDVDYTRGTLSDAFASATVDLGCKVAAVAATCVVAPIIVKAMVGLKFAKLTVTVTTYAVTVLATHITRQCLLTHFSRRPAHNNAASFYDWILQKYKDRGGAPGPVLD